MKKILVSAAALALCACGGNANKFVIDGDIADLTGTVYLLDNSGNVLDSTAVENGRFRFKGEVATPAVRFVADAYGDNTAPSFAQMLYLEPGTILVADDAEQPQHKRVSGTPANDASAAYGEKSRALIQEFRAEETTQERREAIEQEYDALARTALEANRGNYFGAVLLNSQLAYELSGQELLDEIAKFPADLQQTEILTSLREKAEQKMRTDIGQPYIDIQQPDASGSAVSLKSVIENPANKYTLVDFWASWCGPCMGEVPHLKKTYEEFHKAGFEIYGVSFDQDRDKWLGAVEQNGMNWIHVSELNGFDNQAGRDYAVQAIPSNFLIDASGSIVATNLRGEALYEKISELLAE